MEHNEEVVFTLDGDKHYKEDCWCGLELCKRCGNKTVHYQPVYGGYIRRCSSCGEQS